MTSLMRWTVFLALFAALLIVPTAHAAADPTTIIRDCADDDVLQGDYSISELRNARSNLPTDIDEYSACRDVLARALAEASGSDSAGGSFGREQSGGVSGASGGDSGGNTGGDVGAGSTEGGTTSAPAPSSTPAPAHSPEEDARLLDEAATIGERGAVVGGRAVSPGETRLAAQVGRNSVPATTVAVLALFLVTLLVVLALPLIRRRRGVARPRP